MLGWFTRAIYTQLYFNYVGQRAWNDRDQFQIHTCSPFIYSLLQFFFKIYSLLQFKNQLIHWAWDSTVNWGCFLHVLSLGYIQSWIASIFFVNCKESCPVQSQKLSPVHHWVWPPNKMCILFLAIFDILGGGGSGAIPSGAKDLLLTWCCGGSLLDVH